MFKIRSCVFVSRPLAGSGRMALLLLPLPDGSSDEDTGHDGGRRENLVFVYGENIELDAFLLPLADAWWPFFFSTVKL